MALLQAEKYERVVQELQAVDKANRDKYEAQGGQVQQLNSFVEQLIKQIDGYKELVSTCRTRLEESEKARQGLEKKTQKSDLAILEMHEERTKLGNQVAELTKKRDKLASLCRTLQMQAKEQREELSQLRGRLGIEAEPSASDSAVTTDGEGTHGTRQHEDDGGDRASVASTAAPKTATAGDETGTAPQEAHGPASPTAL